MSKLQKLQRDTFGTNVNIEIKNYQDENGKGWLAGHLTTEGWSDLPGEEHDAHYYPFAFYIFHTPADWQERLDAIDAFINRWRDVK